MYLPQVKNVSLTRGAWNSRTTSSKTAIIVMIISSDQKNTLCGPTLIDLELTVNYVPDILLLYLARYFAGSYYS